MNLLKNLQNENEILNKKILTLNDIEEKSEQLIYDLKNKINKLNLEKKNKTMENVDKYIEAQNELYQIKEKFETNGITRIELLEIKNENDSLKREVMILRVGMNTFKELYNATNMQLKHLDLNEKKNLDELDMYKRALKELQGESNQNSFKILVNGRKLDVGFDRLNSFCKSRFWIGGDN